MEANLVFIAQLEGLEGLLFGDVGVDRAYLAGPLVILPLHVLLELLALELYALANDLLLLLGELAGKDVVLPHSGYRLLVGDDVLGIAGCVALGILFRAVLLALLPLLLFPLYREHGPQPLDYIIFILAKLCG